MFITYPKVCLRNPLFIVVACCSDFQLLSTAMQRPPAAQFVQGPPIIYATPQPYQVPLPVIQQQQILMDQLANNIFHDQARICSLEQQLDTATRKISEVIGNHELLSCKLYSLNEVVQVIFLPRPRKILGF